MTTWLKTAVMMFLLVAGFNAIASDKPLVVVSIQPLALLLENIVGDEVEIKTLLPAGATPHDFVLRPSHIKMLDQASLLIWMGEETEPYLRRMASRVKNKAQVLDLSLSSTENSQHSHDHGHGHSIDPHRWLSWQQAKTIQESMLESVARVVHTDKIDSGTAIPGAWQDKMAAEQKQWQEHFAGLHGQLEGVPGSGERLYIVYHDAYSYMEEELGLGNKLAISNMHGESLSLKKAALVKAAIQQHDPACVVASRQWDQKLLDKLYNGREYTVIEIDPMAQDRGYSSYLEWLGTASTRLVNCILSKG